MQNGQVEDGSILTRWVFWGLDTETPLASHVVLGLCQMILNLGCFPAESMFGFQIPHASRLKWNMASSKNTAFVFFSPVGKHPRP